MLEQFDADVQQRIAVLREDRAAFVDKDARLFSGAEEFENARVLLALQTPPQIDRRRFQQVALSRHRLLLDDDGASDRPGRRGRCERAQMLEQLRQVEGLDEEALGAGLRELILLLRVALEDAADQDDAGVRTLRTNLLGDVEARHFGQQAIEDGSVEVAFDGERLDRCQTIADSHHGVAGPPQVLGDGVSQAGVVFGEEDLHAVVLARSVQARTSTAHCP